LSYPTSAIFCWIFAAFVELFLYVTVSCFESESQLASLAPASFAAFSILVLHIPQLPETLNVSVFVCPKEIVVLAINKAATENKRNVFILCRYKI